MKKKEKTIESKVAEAVLQQPISVVVDNLAFEVQPPTPATLMLVSKYVSQMPAINDNTKDVLLEILRKAKDCKVVGKIASTMILGAKRINEHRMVDIERVVVKTKKRKWWQKKKTAPNLYTEIEKVKLLETDWLSWLINERMTIVELRDLLVQLLGTMQIADFFAITISLNASNILRPQEMGTKARGE